MTTKRETLLADSLKDNDQASQKLLKEGDLNIFYPCIILSHQLAKIKALRLSVKKRQGRGEAEFQPCVVILFLFSIFAKMTRTWEGNRQDLCSSKSCTWHQNNAKKLFTHLFVRSLDFHTDENHQTADSVFLSQNLEQSARRKNPRTFLHNLS